MTEQEIKLEFIQHYQDQSLEILDKFGYTFDTDCNEIIANEQIDPEYRTALWKCMQQVEALRAQNE